MENVFKFFKINDNVKKYADNAMKKCSGIFGKIDKISEYNQQKVLAAFIDNKISESHFIGTTGYGYGDRGREMADKVFAYAFGSESAIARMNFASGTHTISVMLFGILRPGDKMLCITGTPYDTLQGVIGIDETKYDGCLKDFNIEYEEIDLENNDFNYEKIKNKLTDNVKMVYIQRSRGYSSRKSLSVKQIESVSKFVKNINNNIIVAVDNCYGEFTEEHEPTECGADIMAGSLIKNAGGGIASSGGYIAGKKNLVDLCAGRLTTPNLKNEIGSFKGGYRELFLGLYYAPHTVAEALKSAVFTSALFSNLGYNVSPYYDEDRHDIVQIIYLENEKSLISFCQGLQSGSPIDSFVVPEAWEMPGYDCKVVMASGSFTSGSSIELSADAPIREPYCVYMQGGLNFYASKISVLLAVQKMLNDGTLQEGGKNNETI